MRLCAVGLQLFEGHTPSVNVWLSSPTAVTTPHYDIEHNVFVQVSGCGSSSVCACVGRLVSAVLVCCFKILYEGRCMARSGSRYSRHLSTLSSACTQRHTRHGGRVCVCE